MTDAIDALFASAPPSQAAPVAAQDPHAAVDSLFANLPAKKTAYPLTVGGAALGSGEIAAAGLGNIFPAVGNAAVDLYRLTHGEPQKQTFGYFHPGAAGQNVLSHLGQLPTGLHDAQNGQPINIQTALSRLRDPLLAPETIQNRPMVANAVKGVERVGGDLATLLPVSQLTKDAAEGITAARAAGEAARAPTKQALADAASVAYKRAEDAGVVVKPDSFQGLQQNLAEELRKQGLDPTLHPATTAAVNRIAGAQGPQSLQDMEILRRVAQHAESSPNPADQRLAGHVVDSLDDFVENLKPTDVTAGNPREGAQALVDARNLWSRKRKADVIDERMRRASLQAPQFSGSGLENAVRTQFRQLAMNQRRLARFTPEEQAAITKVAKGGPIENSLRMLGKFAPTGVVSAALSGGAGALAGGPLGAVALPAAGWLGREAATKMTLRNAARAGELVRRGPPMRVLPEAAQAAAETPPVPKPILPLPAPSMVAGPFGVARNEQLANLGLTPDIRAAAAAHPGLARPGILPPPLALPAPGQVAIPLSNDAAITARRLQSLGLTPDIARAGASHPGTPHVMLAPPPLALPAPGQVAIPLSNDAVAAMARNRALGMTPGTLQAATAHPGFPRPSAAPIEPQAGLLAPSNVVKMPVSRVKVRSVKPVIAQRPGESDIEYLVRKAGYQAATPEEIQKLVKAGYAGYDRDGTFHLYPQGKAAAGR